MNASLWQLENVTTGQRRTLAGWGFSTASLARRNLDVDELTLSGTVADVFADLLFGYLDKVILWRGSVRYWVGWVTQLPAYASAATEARTYVASGAWWWLEHTIYQQPRTVWINDGDDEATEKTGVTVLQLDGAGAAINIAAQVEVGLQYAIDQGAPLAIGTLTLSQFAPLDEARDLTCAEVVRRSLRWSPDSVGWWEYDTGTPTFRLDRRGNLSAESVSLVPGEAGGVTEFSLRPRYDLRVGRVLLNYERTGVRADESQYNYITSDAAGAGGDGVGTFVATIRLGFVGGAAELVPSGLAAHLYGALSVLQWEGEVVVREDDCTGVVVPGVVLNLADGRAEWETMGATVQELTEALLVGDTRIGFGPAAHLGTDELLDIVRQSRARQGDTGQSGSNGSGSPPPGGGGGLGGQSIELQLCGGGTVRVLKG